MTAPHLRIERVRMRSTDGNHIALKLGLQQALRRVRPRSTHLPPHAILVIRRLQSQLGFGLKTSQMHRWQRHVEAQLDAAARRALRPVRQYVPSAAECVIFYDEVELLYCYTRDMLAGRSAWYWARLFPPDATSGRAVGEQLVNGWEIYPRALPHTLVQLQPRESQRALYALNRSQLSRLAHLLHATFALPHDVLQATVPEATAMPGPDEAARDGDEKPHPAATAPAPWRDWLLPRLEQELAPQAAYILGLSHVLVRHPRRARQRSFAEEAKAWLEQAASPRRANRADSAPVAGKSLGPSKVTEPAQAEPRPARAPSEAAKQEVVTTALGGAFFLLNLLSHLDLPAAIPALNRLHPWALLGALAADLLGDDYAPYRADRLWATIKELAGLEAGARWGEALTDTENFHLPPQWLSQTSTSTIAGRLEKGNGRLRVWQEDSPILIADLPVNPAALRALEAKYEDAGITLELEQRSGWTALADATTDLVAPPLAWYVARLRPFLTSFLVHLTGQAASSILRHPAKLIISRTHVDVVFSLEQINIALRRTGLDRTPGWLPDLGMIITIHFE